MTFSRKICAGLSAVVLTAQLGAAPAAAAKVSYAEAWRLCKAELDNERVPPLSASNDRYLRGGACMKRYGYHF